MKTIKEMRKTRNLNEQFEEELSEQEMMSNTSPLSEFAAVMLTSAVTTHMMHWSTRSYSNHIALAAYYDAIPELIDAIVEACQGKYGLISNYPTSVNLNASMNPESYMNQMKEYVSVKRMELPQDSEIQNEIDNVATLIDSTLYKLRFLS